MNTTRLVSIVCAGFVGVQLSDAAPLTEARVTKIINDVRVVDPQKGARTAAVHDVIKDELAVRTGVKSRSELRFQDNTLTRLGPESSFSFTTGTRDMNLGRGTMLLQVPKGLGGAVIRTAAVTAAITGTTIMLEYVPAKSVKVIVLEGSLRLSLAGKFGEQLTLRPGQMVLMPPDAKHLPQPVTVDIARVMRTSALVKMGGGSSGGLPSKDLIVKEIETQEAAKADNTLVATNMTLRGSGNDVVVSQATEATRRSQIDQNKFTPTPAALPTPPTVGDSTVTAPAPAIPAPSATPAINSTGSTVTATPPPTVITPPSPAATPKVKDGNDDGDNHNGDNHNGDNHDGDKEDQDKKKKKHDGHGLSAPTAGHSRGGGSLAGHSAKASHSTGTATRVVRVTNSDQLAAMIESATSPADKTGHQISSGKADLSGGRSADNNHSGRSRPDPTINLSNYPASSPQNK